MLRIALGGVKVYYEIMGFSLPGRDRAAAAGFLMLLAVGMPGCAQPFEAETSAPTSTLPPGAALTAARVAAGGIPGALLGQGIGNSMQPIYGNNTVFLIAPIAFEDLQPGMNVAYRTPRGDQIVHTLQYKINGAWVIEGFNERAPDSHRVTPDNLVGVVYGTFQSNAPPQDK